MARDRILVQDLLLRGIVGVHSWERTKPQDILINLVLYADLAEAGRTDELSRSVDYRAVTKRVIALVEQAKRYTVEALAEDIARLCLEDPQVERAVVRVEKPGALRFARSVGVEIDRRREPDA